MLARNIFIGAIAGLVATAPMTKVMKLMHRQLPAPERYPLPPSEIVESATEQMGVADKIDEEEHVVITYVAHYGYGAAAGALFAPVALKLDVPPVAAGVAYGLKVWAVSYLGLLPALRLIRPATEHPPRRAALMIAAHVVWGAALGAVVDALGEHEA